MSEICFTLCLWIYYIGLNGSSLPGKSFQEAVVSGRGCQTRRNEKPGQLCFMVIANWSKASAPFHETCWVAQWASQNDTPIGPHSTMVMGALDMAVNFLVSPECIIPGILHTFLFQRSLKARSRIYMALVQMQRIAGLLWSWLEL